MTDRLIEVKPWGLEVAWKEALEFLLDALKRNDECSIYDIYELLKSGDLTLWMFYNDESKKAFGSMITQVIEHPHKKVFGVFLMGTNSFERFKPLFKDMVAHARSIGAASIDCAGRLGLERLLPKLGFKKSYVVMAYDLRN